MLEGRGGGGWMRGVGVWSISVSCTVEGGCVAGWAEARGDGRSGAVCAVRRQGGGGGGAASTSAPCSAPTEVPTMRSGFTSRSRSACSIPTSAAPACPPPPSTNATCRSTARAWAVGAVLLKAWQRDADEPREPASAVCRTRGVPMDAAQFERLDVDQAATLLLWRFKKLTEAGHDTVRSLMMAGAARRGSPARLRPAQRRDREALAHRHAVDRPVGSASRADDVLLQHEAGRRALRAPVVAEHR